MSADLSEHLRHLPLDPILDQELAVPQLFLTAGHLCMRYEAFKLYPTALWTLTSKFNPEGYIAAIESFLAMDFPQLDVGYSAELQYDARACENYAESIRYMVSSQVQTELVEILEEAKACSLDVEREHFLAKKAEGRRGVRLTTVGRSSRNNILRIYRGSRNLHIAKTLEERNVAMKLRFMNIWALAVQTNPEWFARGRGSLHWEQNVSLREMQALTFAGDHAKLRQFVENNKDDLREEARKLRETAKRTLEEAEHPIPFSNAEWLAWMTDHEVEFRECMQQATVTRRSYSERVSASSPLHGVPRLQVKPEKSADPAWVRKLRGAKHGFVLILGPDAKQEIYSCALKGEVWAMVLQTDIGSGPSCFAWHCDTAFQTFFRPLHELEELRVFWGSPDAAIGVHRLRLQIRVVSDVVTLKVRVCAKWIYPQGLLEPLQPRMLRRTTTGARRSRVMRRIFRSCYLMWIQIWTSSWTTSRAPMSP